jgi:transposase-like protein
MKGNDLMACPWCAAETVCKNGRDRRGEQVYRCQRCRRSCTERTGTPFSGCQFPTELIALAVKWYLRDRLSYADVAGWLVERGVCVDPSTVYDWVQRFTPLYQEAARPYRYPVGRTWAVEETYIRVAGQWQYAYRAIDEVGRVVDVYLSPTRDAQAAERFFRCAQEETEERPERVTTDRAACYPPALERVLPEAEHVTGKMVQQGIERDHQHVKGRTRPMRGFKTARGARIVCGGHGFLRNLRSGFYDLGATVAGERHRASVRLSRAWAALTTGLLAA